MLASLSLGSSPAEEPCAQLGTANYDVRADAECCVYRDQLLRLYRAHHGTLPRGTYLKIAYKLHDYGNYYEVDVVYDPDARATVEAAIWLVDNIPAEWDQEARKALGLGV